MWLIVGLGNPGAKYQLTRHNIGFMSVDYVHKAYGGPSWTSEHKALVSKVKIKSEQALLAKPQTFMNLSGDSVQAIMAFYKISLDRLLVLQDEIDQPFTKMKFQRARGHGGHNGIKDITLKLGTNDYTRLRLGVGRPTHPEMAVADYVLQNFSKDELHQLPDFLNKSVEGIETFVTEGLGKASTLFNV